MPTHSINSSHTHIDIDDYISDTIDRHLSEHRAIFCCYNSCMVRDVRTRYIEILENKVYNINGLKEIKIVEKLNSDIKVKFNKKKHKNMNG